MSPESGNKHCAGFTSDGKTLVSFVESAGGAGETSGFWAIRRQARSGAEIGRALLRVDTSQLGAGGPSLLNDDLVWLYPWKGQGPSGPTFLFALETGERVAGPIEVNLLGFRAVDPAGNWFADVRPGGKRVRVASFRDDQTMFEVSRPGHQALGANALDRGDRLLIHWRSTGDQSESIESWEIPTSRRIAHAILRPRLYGPFGRVLGGRFQIEANGDIYSFGLADSDFGSERLEPTVFWQGDYNRSFVPSPDYVVTAKPHRWTMQHSVNWSLSRFGFRGVFQTDEFTVVVIDRRTTQTVAELPRGYDRFVLAMVGDLITATDPHGRLAVWDLRRSPERWAYAFGVSTTIGMLLLACWRNRRCRYGASSTKMP
jgi:hypothetical protein